MELSIATALKRHPWSLANTTRFVALSCLAWLAVTTIVWLAWDDVPPFRFCSVAE